MEASTAISLVLLASAPLTFVAARRALRSSPRAAVKDVTRRGTD